jgi:hypothetical protein
MRASASRHLFGSDCGTRLKRDDRCRGTLTPQRRRRRRYFEDASPRPGQRTNFKAPFRSFLGSERQWAHVYSRPASA